MKRADQVGADDQSVGKVCTGVKTTALQYRDSGVRSANHDLELTELRRPYRPHF